MASIGRPIVLEAAEGDLQIELRATVAGGSLRLDFTGTAPQHAGNLNCPLAVTRSACLFALRVLTDPEIPPSAGAARAITVIAPEGSLLNARSPAAVAGGNVETSSRVADVVLGAFGRALGQGTMNNLTLGNEDFTFYETLGGGQGACADADGPSAVHVAMSNTLNTPVEALELEFPLRVTRYAMRRGSGGSGRPPRRRRSDPRARGAGADGVLADHRASPPRAARCRGRRGRGDRAELRRRARCAGEGARSARTGPAPADRDAGWRRIWCGVMRIAFLGLGIMGSRMAANLARGGHELTVWNRTAERARAFASEHRAVAADTPGTAARGAELVFSMVVDGPQVHGVLFGPDGAALGADAGALCVDCSTIGPTWARQIGAELAERGIGFLDAPVTGSAPKAQDGTLTIMVGGEREALARARPALEQMGALVVHCGELGQGQMVKLLNNSVAATNAATIAQALVLGAGTGVDLDAAIEVMGAGSGASAMLALKAGPMRRHDFAPLFKLDHMLKDVALCLEEAERAGVPFGLAAQTRELLAAASAEGLGGLDFAALLEVIERAAHRRLDG